MIREDREAFGTWTLQGTKRWLQSYPWEDLINALSSFWHLPPEQLEARTPREIRALWKNESQKEMSLGETLRLCRRCQTMRPFGKYDCESFVIVAREIVKPFLPGMSPVLAAAVITIVGDYVRGVGDESEMQQTLLLVLEKYADWSDHNASPGGR